MSTSSNTEIDDQTRETLRALIFGAQAGAEHHLNEATSPEAIEAWTVAVNFLTELFNHTNDSSGRQANMLAQFLATRIAHLLPRLGTKHPAWNSLIGLACDLLALRDGRDPLVEGPCSTLSDYLEEIAHLITSA